MLCQLYWRWKVGRLGSGPACGGEAPGWAGKTGASIRGHGDKKDAGGVTWYHGRHAGYGKCGGGLGTEPSGRSPGVGRICTGLQRTRRAWTGKERWAWTPGLGEQALDLALFSGRLRWLEGKGR